MGNIIEAILGITGLALIILVLLQGGKAQGLGGTLSGTSDSNLFQTSKESMTEKKTSKLILGIGIFFVVVSLLAVILINFGIVTIS